jgi:hypothetical protein
MGYGLDGQEIVVQFLVHARDFISSQSIQTSSGTNGAFYSVGAMTLFLQNSSQGVELTTHLKLVMRLRMHAVCPNSITSLVTITIIDVISGDGYQVLCHVIFAIHPLRPLPLILTVYKLLCSLTLISLYSSYMVY